MPRLAIWISLALIALSLFIYAPVQHHDFVAWDDPEYFAENPMVTAGLTWSGFQWAMTTGHMGNWNPLTWLSYMLGVGLFGLSAGPELLINAVLHAFNSMLLFVAPRNRPMKARRNSRSKHFSSLSGRRPTSSRSKKMLTRSNILWQSKVIARS